METTLKSMKPGDAGIVSSLSVKGQLKRRLMDMGVTPGADVKVVKVAPLGDPIEVTLRGYQLSLRKSEAEAVMVSVN